MKKQQHLQKSKAIIRVLSTTDEEYADWYCYRRCYYSSTMCYWVHFGEVGQCGADYGGNHCCCCCCCWLSELCTTDFYLSRNTEGPINDCRSNIRHQMDVVQSNSLGLVNYSSSSGLKKKKLVVVVDRRWRHGVLLVAGILVVAQEKQMMSKRRRHHHMNNFA